MGFKLKIILFLSTFCLALTACSDQEASFPSGDGQLRIVYQIAGDVTTRVDTEPGWNEGWNENKITRIDLFVFDQNGNFYKHIDGGTISIEDASQEEQTLVTDRLTYSEVKSGNYTYYMVANCPQLETASINSLTKLQAEMIEPSLVCNDEQETFIMDAKITETPEEDETTKTITLSFGLVRAASKIRLSVEDDAGKDIIDQCSFKLINYVSTGTSVLADSEKYGEETSQERESMTTAQGWDETLKYEETGSMSKAVFYSYPNDWFDETLLNEEGIFIDEDIYAKDDLIDEDKQTYILLTYEGNEFKVPVNFSIADYNDKPSFTADEINTLRNDYYRMQRNYIYDVTVTIDWEAEDITVSYEILVNAWNDKGNMDITFGDPNL